MEGPLEISLIAEGCPSLNILNERNEIVDSAIGSSDVGRG